MKIETDRMMLLFLMFGCIASTRALTDETEDEVFIVTRKELNGIKHELNKIKGMHQWTQLNQMKSEVNEIHALKHQLEEFNELKQQCREINEIKHQLAELSELRRDAKEMKHRLSRLNETETKLKEMKDLKKELREVKQQLSDMKRLNQQSKEMNNLKQQLKDINGIKYQLKRLNVFEIKRKLKDIEVLKKEFMKLHQILKKSNKRKLRREDITNPQIYFTKENNLKKIAFLMTKNKNKAEKSEEDTQRRFNQTKPSKQLSNKRNRNGVTRVNPVHIFDAEDNFKNRSVRRLYDPTTTQVQTSSRLNQVAFCTELTHILSNLGPKQTIVFDDVITNFGNAYNKNDGIFTVPVEGVYVFTWTTMAKPDYYQGTELVLNGKHVSYAWAAETAGYNTASKTVILHLQQGNEIWIRTDAAGGANYLHNHGHNSFVGFLLK